MDKKEFDDIEWPQEFFIQFMDGKRLLFVLSQGIDWDKGNNNAGPNENRPSISCCLKKKSPSQQRFRTVEFFADEIALIEDSGGHLVWGQDR